MIRTGICSWAEKTLVESGEFYPREARTAEARLRFYASHFDTVEVDSTYYAIPDQKTAWLWDARTPEGFTFHIKAYAPLTGHGVDPRTLPQDMRTVVLPAAAAEQPTPRFAYIKAPEALQLIARRFTEALLPLKRSGKLGLMIFQFPPWFIYKTSNMDYILSCKQMMDGFSLAVEFRHGSWLTAGKARGVLGFLEQNQLAYVTADEPQYGNLSTIPFLPRVTSDTAYFRFHGRNRDNWLKKNIETSLRYAYLYTDAELGEFIPALKETEREAKTTFAMFNNCRKGNAALNALRLKQLLAVNHTPEMG